MSSSAEKPNRAETWVLANRIAPPESMTIMASGAESRTLRTSSEESMRATGCAERGGRGLHRPCCIARVYDGGAATHIRKTPDAPQGPHAQAGKCAVGLISTADVAPQNSWVRKRGG